MDLHEQPPTTGDRAPMLATFAGVAAVVACYAVILSWTPGAVVGFALAAVLVLAALADVRAGRARLDRRARERAPARSERRSGATPHPSH